LNILICNDDGIGAEGIQALASALARGHNVTVVAPESERSGSGHWTSLKSPIKVRQVKLIEGADCYALSGTPVDCVKFGISFIMREKVDLVLAGINHGRNLGTDVLYSGTVGAALEGLIMGYPAAAVSHGGSSDYDFDFAAEFIAKNAEKIRQMSGARCVININFPKGGCGQVMGVRLCPLGREKYQDWYRIYNEQNEEEGYILQSLPNVMRDNPEDCDIVLNALKFITITPIKLDMTDYDTLRELEGKGQWTL
jgi:5'-nucleotidase